MAGFSCGDPLSTRLRRSVLLVLAIWSLVVLVHFSVAALWHKWPPWLELPWSGFDDFALTSDGKLLIYLSLYHRILVYDLEGNFVISLPGLLSGGEHRLATDQSGRYYVSVMNSICEADELDRQNLEHRCSSAPLHSLEGWRLSETGEPEPVLSVGKEELPAGPAEPGDLLVSWVSRSRRKFEVSDGPRIERSHDALLVHQQSGEPVRVTTPWYLYWLKFPFPGSLAWLVTLLFGVWEARTRG